MQAEIISFPETSIIVAISPTVINSVTLITFFSAIYIFYDSIQLGNFFGDFMGLVTATGLAVNAVLVRSAKDRDLLPSAVLGKLCVAVFAFFFVDTFALIGNDKIIKFRQFY